VASGSYDDQDRLRSHGGATYTYNDNGDLETKTVGTDVTTYAYDALGNLRSVELPNGTTLTHQIDGRNRRIAVIGVGPL
jgi:YD repeat-containing protein